jgi:hypothetical protein
VYACTQAQSGAGQVNRLMLHPALDMEPLLCDPRYACFNGKQDPVTEYLRMEFPVGESWYSQRSLYAIKLFRSRLFGCYENTPVTLS